MSDLHRAYFEWKSIGSHLTGCRRPAWDVQQLHRDQPYGGYESGMRVVCWSCGVVHELVAAIGSEQDPVTGDLLSGTTDKVTNTAMTGYGQIAVKVAGAWLHPGPPMFFRPGQEPSGYLVTDTPQSPSKPKDVLGAVFRERGRRGGLVWTAALGYAPATLNTTGLTSRTAAVRWILSTAASRPNAGEAA